MGLVCAALTIAPNSLGTFVIPLQMFLSLEVQRGTSFEAPNDFKRNLHHVLNAVFNQIHVYVQKLTLDCAKLLLQTILELL